MHRTGSVPLLLAAAILILVAALGPAPEARAQDRQEDRVLEAVDVLEAVMGIPDASIPRRLLEEAHAIAIIPRVVKVGFVVGGRRGRGVLLVRQEDGSWGNPAFVVLTAGSVGWQIGAQSADVVLVFRTKRSVEGLIDGTFTLGADAAVAAGPVGRQAQAATDAQLKAEIYSYSRSRGAFAGLSIEGSSIRISDDDNEAFYDAPGVSRQDVLYGGGEEELAVPEAARKLQEAIARYGR